MKKLWQNIGIRVSIISILINILLFIFKLGAGIVGHSNAMVSDAIHSLSDVITTFGVIIGIFIASKKEDKKHPYGHERIESVFTILLSFLLLVTGLSIGFKGLQNVINYNSTNIEIPGLLPLLAAIVSIITKELMYHYTHRVAKKIKSTSMEADAWHHRSDALSSIGAFIGILLSRLGYSILDSVCSVIISLFIVKVAIEIFMEAINQMIDSSCDEEMQKLIVDTILNTEDNIKITDLKTRMFGSKIYIDVEIALDGEMSLKNAHKKVLNIHDTIEETIKEVKHCNIHLVPQD